MRKAVTLLALTMAAAGSRAGAETLKKVPPELNPAKAYILVEYKLMKNPWSNFPGSRKTVPLLEGLIFARYDPVLKDIRGMGRAKLNSVPPKQQQAEPFRNRPVAKSETARLFLIELEPDTWVVQGYGNTSFSLGSYTFALEPGSVTDLGVAAAEPDWAEGDRAPGVGDVFKAALIGPFAKQPDIAAARVDFRPRNAEDMPIPAGLPLERVRPVAFTAGAKFGNYLGGLVNRIEGVNKGSKAVSASPAEPAAEAGSPQN